MREALLYLLPVSTPSWPASAFPCCSASTGRHAHLRRRRGALGWLCYLLTGPLVGNDIIQSFLPPWSSRPGRR